MSGARPAARTEPRLARMVVLFITQPPFREAFAPDPESFELNRPAGQPGGREGGRISRTVSRYGVGMGRGCRACALLAQHPEGATLACLPRRSRRGSTRSLGGGCGGCGPYEVLGGNRAKQLRRLDLRVRR